MTVDSTTAYSSYSNGAATTVAAKKTTLDAQDFMKLLAVQFKSQDPMKPMEDTAFVAQMAQFTALSQSSSLLTEVGSLRTEQQRAIAQSYLGRDLTVSDGVGVVSGTVTGIEYADDGPRVIIGEVTFPLSAVLLGEPGPTSNPQSAAELPPAA